MCHGLIVQRIGTINQKVEFRERCSGRGFDPTQTQILRLSCGQSRLDSVHNFIETL